MTGVSLLGGCAVQPRNTAGPPRFPGFIDAHSHVWSPDIERFPLGPWAVKEQMKPASFTAEQLLELARPHGVDRFVLVQHSPLHGYDPAYLLDCQRRHPGVFAVIAMIDERRPDLPQRLSRLREQGVRGIRINPGIHGDRTPVADPPNWLKAAPMRALWVQATEQRIALCPLLAPPILASLDPMCEEFPDVTCVIDHFGNVEPSDESHVRQLLRLARHRNVHVKLSAYYKFGNRKPPYDGLIPLIRRVIDTFGPHRLMWGSDCPYQLQNGNTYADAVALIRDRIDALPQADRQSMLRETARRLFFS